MCTVHMTRISSSAQYACFFLFFCTNSFLHNYKLHFYCSSSFFVTETWLSPGDFSALKELSPPDCLFNSPRTVGRGGEIATIFKNCFKCKLLPVENFLSFKVLLLRVDLTTSLLCALIYRPSDLN